MALASLLNVTKKTVESVGTSVLRNRGMINSDLSKGELADLYNESLAHTYRIIIAGLAENLKIEPSGVGIFDDSLVSVHGDIDLEGIDTFSLLSEWGDAGYTKLGEVYECLMGETPSAVDGKFIIQDKIAGNVRKLTGSYYTPESLIHTTLDQSLDFVVKRALDSTGNDNDKIGAILGLDVIDPSCGSGNFLMASARRLAGVIQGLENVTDAYDCLGRVIDNCIHGVDLNPMAVAIAQSVLWLESKGKAKCLSKNIICGNAILGIHNESDIHKNIPDIAYKPIGDDDRKYCMELSKLNKSNRIASRVSSLFEDEELGVPNVKLACDLYVAAFLTKKNDSTSGCVPITNDVQTALLGGVLSESVIANAKRVSTEYKPVHWFIAFPDVMGKGGFDVVVGNPPWETLTIKEKEFFSGTEISEAGNASVRKSLIEDWASGKEGTRKKEWAGDFKNALWEYEARNRFYKHGFPLTGKGVSNTYALFSEKVLSLINATGRASIVVPTGIATDATTAPFFGHLVSQKHLVTLFDFENREKLFPAVDSRMKFCILTLGTAVKAAEFAFFLQNTTELEDTRRRFTLTPEQIINLNPNTKTAPVFRSQKDAELAEKIYARVPVLMEDDREDGNPWGLSFMTMFHITNDSGLFRSATQLEGGTVGEKKEKLHLKGRDWVGESGLRYVPLYEAKMVHQYDHRWATYDLGVPYDEQKIHDVTLDEKQDPEFEPTPKSWVPKNEIDTRLSKKGWNKEWLMGWRDITNSTNERTVIADIFPRSGVGHKIPLILLNRSILLETNICLLANLSGLPLDFCARYKIGGTNLTYFIFKQLPILPPSAYSEEDTAFIVPRVLELTYTSWSMAPFARDLDYEGPPFAWDEDRRAILRAELDAWYALAYGLERDDLRFILDPADIAGEDYPSRTFTTLRDGELRQYGEYRTARLALAAYDKLASEGKKPFAGNYK